jgi:hypothetical protein
VGQALESARFRGILEVAVQDEPTGPLDLVELTRRLDPDQLSLI